MLRAAIIGAGPAGAACAFHLCRAGAHVTLFERARFPRIKVCGEFISPGATPFLESIVPAPDLAAAGARRVDRLVLELGEREAQWQLPEPAWAISRETLDSILLDRAATSGARVEQPASVRAVEYSDRGVRILLTDARAIAADIVIHADGSGRHDPAGPVKNDPRLVGFKCHLRLPHPLRGVRMRTCRDAYVGTIAVEGDLGTCALVVRREVVARFGPDSDAMLRALWPGYAPAWRVSDWKSCGVPRSRYVKPGHPRSFRIGNAAAAVDPVGGEGIGLALWSAAELSRRLIAHLCLDESQPRSHTGPLRSEGATGCSHGWRSPQATATRGSALRISRPGGAEELQGSFLRAHSAFARSYSHRLRTRLPACRAAAQLFMRPRLVLALWPLTLVPRLVLRPWYALTGKPVGILG